MEGGAYPFPKILGGRKEVAPIRLFLKPPSVFPVSFPI